ncbi:MAG: ankyrin repeat domain-containing protein [Rhodobacteraceae bacterium]|nr:ankyrin repeat domain-containing protein [Paracoccaceae bacterium]
MKALKTITATLAVFMVTAEAQGADCKWLGRSFWEAATPDMVADCASEEAYATARGKFGETPLHWAVEFGTFGTVQALLASGMDIEAKDQSGWRPLHWAVVFGTPGTVRALLESGANVNARTENGETPLYWAKNYSVPETIEALLNRGAQEEG